MFLRIALTLSPEYLIQCSTTNGILNGCLKASSNENIFHLYWDLSQSCIVYLKPKGSFGSARLK